MGVLIGLTFGLVLWGIEGILLDILEAIKGERE